MNPTQEATVSEQVRIQRVCQKKCERDTAFRYARCLDLANRWSATGFAAGTTYRASGGISLAPEADDLLASVWDESLSSDMGSAARTWLNQQSRWLHNHGPRSYQGAVRPI